MVNIRLISKIIGIALIVEGVLMLFSAVVAFLTNSAAGALIMSGLVTIVCGGMIYSPTNGKDKPFGSKEGYLIFSGIWIAISLMGSLPYILSGTTSFVNALFESISGFTCTGATTIANIDNCSKGILFWRSTTQWYGGLLSLLIVFTLFQKFTNVQMSAIGEISAVSHERIASRTDDIVKHIATVYVIVTIIEAILLNFSSLDVFDSVTLSMSTISTGGFSPHNGSVTAFATPYIKIVLVLFMFLAGANIVFIYYAANKHHLFHNINNEYRLYFSTIAIFSVFAIISLYFDNEPLSFGESFTTGLFHVVSTVSTTGFYANSRYGWSSFMSSAIILLMIGGACSGSSGGGIRQFRILLIFKMIGREIKQAVHPAAIIPIVNNEKVVPKNILHTILIFTLLFFMVMFVGIVVLTFVGVDFSESIAITISMLSNVGSLPSSIDTFQGFVHYSGGIKMFLGLLMLLGRVELFPLIMLFTPGFYRNM